MKELVSTWSVLYSKKHRGRGRGADNSNEESTELIDPLDRGE